MPYYYYKTFDVVPEEIGLNQLLDVIVPANWLLKTSSIIADWSSKWTKIFIPETPMLLFPVLHTGVQLSLYTV